MAGVACMSEDGNPAVFVGTMLENGESVRLCDVCLVAWAASVLNLMTGVDPEPFLRAISEDEPIPYEVADDAAAAGTENPAAEAARKPATPPEGSGAAQPSGSPPRSRKRAESASGRTPNGSAGAGTAGDPAGTSEQAG